MEILKRVDVPQEFTWDLTPVFANDDAWFAEYEALKAYPGKISEYRNARKGRRRTACFSSF